MSRPQDILEFWFGRPGEKDYARPRIVWFQNTPEFTEEARRFSADYEAAAAGELSEWEKSPEGALALVLLLDQFSNILHKGEAGAFAADPLARAIARRAIENGYDGQFPDVHRWFFYLPFEHSEDLADQAWSVSLFQALEPTEANLNVVHWAIRHQRVIERFGRFPNRNEALGRESTPEELEFLAGPDAPY